MEHFDGIAKVIGRSWYLLCLITMAIGLIVARAWKKTPEPQEPKLIPPPEIPAALVAPPGAPTREEVIRMLQTRMRMASKGPAHDVAVLEYRIFMLRPALPKPALKGAPRSGIEKMAANAWARAEPQMAALKIKQDAAREALEAVAASARDEWQQLPEGEEKRQKEKELAQLEKEIKDAARATAALQK